MLLHQLLFDGANRRPDHVAFHWVERGKSLTYAEAAIHVDALAGALHSLGVVKGDRVTIFAHNGMDYLLSMLAAWRIGAVSSLVNVKLSAHLDEYLVDHTPRIVIYTHDMVEPVRRSAGVAGSVRRLICMDGPQEGAESLPELLAAGLTPPPDPGDEAAIAHLSYTSGTTGKPKGACLAHEPTACAAACIAERLQHGPGDLSCGPTALSSSYQLVGNVLPALHVKATCAVMSHWQVDTGFAALAETDATVFVANPPLLTDVLEQSRKEGGPPDNLRMGLSGGGPVPPALKRAWRDELGLPLVESYGQSELGGFVALGKPVLPEDAHVCAVGRPLPDKEVRILDAHDNELPTGRVGEICLRGGFMKEYWGRPDKTSETLRNGWLHTGDVGSMSADEFITMRGRTSELLVVNGETWFPRDVEEALMTLEGIREAALVGLHDGREGHLPIGFIVGRTPLGATEIKERIQDRLPHDLSAMRVETIDAFPMTPTGKIAKAELRELARARLAPDTVVSSE